ncbi:esterase-like activity of phytase family protein [Haloarcula sp. H-GB4]|uniref:esterase-like activity of phytase family protein n=1 Tax=Haloarcula sp. H-GB4 TaxID=3069755 RepID=UPI0027AFAECD|nr:esterase-like activity of phytase family protein [Haloarcula sp. H-GB4]MDQ2075035.1 esterase-like activity of phytase family protein [Haloarcula sp. H-GB4]
MGDVTFRGGNTLDLIVGLGSGACTRDQDPDDLFYTIADRGPNFNCSDAPDVANKSVESLCQGDTGDKIFTNPGYTPSIYTVRLDTGARSNTAMVTETIPLKDSDGNDITAISNPLEVTTTEGAYSINGNRIPYDPNGMDIEGVVRMTDDTFWIAEEYGPSIAEVNPNGQIVARHVPEGVDEDLADATYPIMPSLPAVWRRRKLNRGIESLGISPDETQLVFAIQSPFANPDVETSESSRNIRVATFDPASGEMGDQYLYRLDLPETFRRDNVDGTPDQSDVKISELRMLDEDRLLVLERVSATTKLYVVSMADTDPIPAEYDELDRDETLESLSEDELQSVDSFEKTLVFSTDDYDGFPSKIEGIAMPTEGTMILINDNDFGYTDVDTKIARIQYQEPIV